MKHHFEFIEPVDEAVLSFIEQLPNQALGKTVRFHTDNESPFDLGNIRMALLSIEDKYDETSNIDFLKIRKQLYNLFPGNWSHSIADLGTVVAAENFEHTNYLLQNTLAVLIKNNIVPIILGGSQKYAYSNYRAYESLEHLVNVVNIDYRFDLGDASMPIEGHSFAGKMVVEKPIILFNYANLGYQSYLNPIEETDLMENLYFEKYRLGEIKSDITLAEPVLRDADMVCIDYNAIKSNETGFATLHQPNGFEGTEICALCRYAGISDKVSSFGIYEINSASFNTVGENLIAQMIWYFVEGFNYRSHDFPYTTRNQYKKFIVAQEGEDLIFYQSPKSGRWWMEVPLKEINNKWQRNSLIPCQHKDYLDACNNIVPERWWRAFKKF